MLFRDLQHRITECVLSKTSRLAAVVVPRASVLQPCSVLSKLARNDWNITSLYHLVGSKEKFTICSDTSEDSEAFTLLEAYEWLDGRVKASLEPPGCGLVILADVFSDEQAKCLFVNGRRVINTNPGCAFVLVVAGSWNYFQLRQGWASQGSPLEPSYLKFCPGLEDWQVSDLMEKNGLGAYLDKNTIEQLIISETGGAEWLCSDIINELARRSKSEASEHIIADIFTDIQESPQTIGRLKAHIEQLSEKQLAILVVLLKRRCAKASDIHMGDAFKLWLLGLAQLRFIPSISEKTLWLMPPAPIIERCLRATDVLPNDCSAEIGGNYNLLLCTPDVNARVYLSVFKIENFLRDLISSMMQAKYSNDWIELKLSAVSTSLVKSSVEASDVQKLVDARLVEIGLLDEKEILVGHPQKPKVSIRDAILAARKRLLESPAKRTRLLSDLAFLTFHEIILILTDDVLYRDCFSAIFRSKSQLSALLAEIKEIRNAMAHNNPLKSAVLVEIAQLERKLLDIASVKIE